MLDRRQRASREISVDFLADPPPWMGAIVVATCTTTSGRSARLFGEIDSRDAISNFKFQIVAGRGDVWVRAVVAAMPPPESGRER
ncbi:hypothetical protein [Streptomyces violascens]|uniref:hypothetical protein n=1 Tax=Streptomyces violascens TaxID=67381 RepID=UPI0036BAAC6A